MHVRLALLVFVPGGFFAAGRSASSAKAREKVDSDGSAFVSAIPHVNQWISTRVLAMLSTALVVKGI